MLSVLVKAEKRKAMATTIETIIIIIKTVRGIGEIVLCDFLRLGFCFGLRFIVSSYHKA